MELNNTTSVRQILEQLPTETLREMLDKELHTEPVDGDSIRLLLQILRERENTVSVEMTPNLERAWEKYQRDTDEIWKDSRRSNDIRRFVKRAVSAAAVLILLLIPIAPQEAGAESLWDALIRWTAEIVEFFGPRENVHRLVEYEFQTDNPGLQQIYDAVVELGIMDPVVPMWLPEGYKLEEFNQLTFPSKTRIHSRFVKYDQELVFYIDIYKADVSRMYQWDENEMEAYEHSGIVHQIMKNNAILTSVWSRDNLECSLSLNCQEDMMQKILKSIYTMESD